MTLTATLSDADTDRCESIVREVTDRIAASPPRFQAGDSIQQTIGRIREASSVAKSLLEKQLKLDFPAIKMVDLEDKDSELVVEKDSFWLYDPIDGAYHCAQGLPLWSASLALVRDGRPVAAFVYDPTCREMFSARVGRGARLNGTLVNASNKNALETAVVGTAVPPFAQKGAEQEVALTALAAIAPRVFVVRQMAAASLQLAYVAAGRLDAYWELGRDFDDWMAGLELRRTGHRSHARPGRAKAVKYCSSHAR
jgi:myo-inositol-1(or 4)-monophosphatase